jgi:sugar lactone lactonase YvrE
VLFSFDSERDRFLPEGPRNVLVDGQSALAWVNIQTTADATSGDIHLRFWDSGEQRVLPQSARPGFLLPTDVPNVVVVGREKEVGTLNLSTGEWQTLGTIPDEHPRTIINDGEVVLGGEAIVFGTKDVRFEEKIAELYLFTLKDRQVSVLKSGQTCSNGKVVAEEVDRLILYDIDTPDRQVMRYRLDLANRKVIPDRVAVDLTQIDGFPDGMVGCGDDTVIIAMYHPTSSGPGLAHRFSLRTGARIEEWQLPNSPRVTCPLLVQQGSGVNVIFTTATEGMPAELREKCPYAGNLFIANTSLTNAPPEVLVRLAR